MKQGDRKASFNAIKDKFKVRHHIRRWKFALLSWVGLMLCLSLVVCTSKPALASIHTYPESNVQVMYRSQQSLRDSSDKAWQAILYKRLKAGKLDCMHLRLVGFPGITELAHPVPLKVTAETGEVLLAADVLVNSSLPSNVAEYDFLEVMNQLHSNKPLRLEVPLKSGRFANLLVPPFAVREWRLLVNQS